MPASIRRSRTALLLAALVSLALLAAACSDDSGDSSSTTTEATTTTANDTSSDDTSSDDEAFVKDVQGQLQQIGCYDGEIDGDDGAETQAAIVAFQEAEGLADDDEVGPETEAALKAAVASGRHDVCDGGGSSTTSTTAAGGATSTTASGGGSTSTTATPSGNVAPCTRDALQSGLASGETLHQWQCARDSSGQDYAGGTQTKDGSSDKTDFVLWAKDGKWTDYTGSCDAVPESVKSYCS